MCSLRSKGFGDCFCHRDVSFAMKSAFFHEEHPLSWWVRMIIYENTKISGCICCNDHMVYFYDIFVSSKRWGDRQSQQKADEIVLVLGYRAGWGCKRLDEKRCTCVLLHGADSSLDETASNGQAACLDRGASGVRVVFFRWMDKTFHSGAALQYLWCHA